MKTRGPPTLDALMIWRCQDMVFRPIFSHLSTSQVKTDGNDILKTDRSVYHFKMKYRYAESGSNEGLTNSWCVYAEI